MEMQKAEIVKIYRADRGLHGNSMGCTWICLSIEHPAVSANVSSSSICSMMRGRALPAGSGSRRPAGGSTKPRYPRYLLLVTSIERSFQDATFDQCLSKAITTIKYRLRAEDLRA